MGSIRCTLGIAVAMGITVAILCCALTAELTAQEKGSNGGTKRRSPQEQRRVWVRTQVPKLISDERQRTEILNRLNHLSDDQVQQLATVMLDELEARRKSQFNALRAANAREALAREQAFQEQLVQRIPPQPFLFAPPVGFYPVITWLPEGTSLSAQAVVSPDGRHVRMNVAPFFSTIGPVHTFNFMTGETRRYDP